VGVVQNLLQQAETVLEFDLTAEAAGSAGAQAAAMARRELTAAPAGSDHQLAWARGFAATARSAHDYALLQALLDGSETIDGLTVDADLRWSFLHSLARGGRADQSALDAELVRDATAAGRRKHAGALAARPTAQAKAAAWKLAVECADQPNDLLREVLLGFATAPETPELLRPYVEPYFAALDELWAKRSIENARRIAMLAFPRGVVEEETLARADRWLAEAGHAPALRRLVLEARDDLARALRARNAG
jgi:aminopeptidase N